jgi:peptide/nickel transport system permease protein
MSRIRYIGVRTLQTVFLLWMLMTLLFFFFRLMPGSFVDIMVFQGATPEAVAAFKEQWGLNDPIWVQYLRYVENLAQLEAGTSIRYRVPVFEFVRLKIFNSFILIAPAITLAYILGSGIGLLTGTRRDSFVEEYGLIPVILAGSTPSFVLAVFAVVIFAGNLGWFPTSGMVSTMASPDAAWWETYLSFDFLKHWILPFSVITLRYLLVPSMIMRTSVVEALGQDFSYYQRVAGLSKWKCNWHIAKHASLPVITLYPVSMTRAIGGLVLVEIVFNWPGIGSALVSSVFARDIPVIQFVFFLVGAMVIIANFGIDLLYGVIDPRVSISGEN